MKMPNGYGSVVKPTGKRRKPWASSYFQDCLKLILGHSIQGVTKGVYTQKTLEELLVEVNKI